MNWATIFLQFFYQNIRFLRNRGTLKITVLQCYEVLWIYNIDAICTVSFVILSSGRNLFSKLGKSNILIWINLYFDYKSNNGSLYWNFITAKSFRSFQNRKHTWEMMTSWVTSFIVYTITIDTLLKVQKPLGFKPRGMTSQKTVTIFFVVTLDSKLETFPFGKCKKDHPDIDNCQLRNYESKSKGIDKVHI